HDTPSVEELREMLRCIPPRGDYKDHWLRLLAAVHSAYPGQDGIDLCEGWSPGKPGEIAEKFRSFGRYRGPRGAATIATVIYEAKRWGYQPPAGARFTPGTPPAAGGDGATPARVAALEREVAEERRLRTQAETALARCREEHARKDARIAALETKVKALDACIAHPDQTVGGAAPDIAEAVAAAYQRGDTLVRDGKEYARLVNKQASKRRSATTIGRAVKAIGAARPEDIFTRAEPLETDRFKGTVDISYIHVPPERRRDDADIALYVLPPATKKRHGGDRRIAVPPEVARQDAPVRRETRRVERFFSLATDAQLGVIEGKPFIDFCAADGTPMTAAEAEAFQVESGAQPPPPPRYRPAQSRLQDARRVPNGSRVQVATGSVVGTAAADPAESRVQDATGPAPVPLFRNRGCRNPNCDRVPDRGGYCAEHHPDNWGDYLAQREYAPRGGPAAYERVVLDA
ncbi:MAG: PriCT-2 domain-containing protein, partial [Chloroflexota bacterium]|nr:PriCT-2 domain-containing protein [Chloroflexota bacterium]